MTRSIMRLITGHITKSNRRFYARSKQNTVVVVVIVVEFKFLPTPSSS